MTPIFHAEVRSGGQLNYLEGPQYERYLSTLKVGREVEVIVRPKPERATWSQHKYYRGIILPAAADVTGYTEAEIHLIFKAMFMPMRFHSRDGLGSTSQLNRRQFAAYLEFVIMFCEGWLEIDLGPAERALEARCEPDLVELVSAPRSYRKQRKAVA